MPEAWLFLHYVNVFRWPLEGIITSLFEGRDDRMEVLGLACEAGGCTCTVKEPETVPTQREYLVMG